jgi:hypothetical protein
MDVSELLAQKYRNREERIAAAANDPEFTLTEREFDHRLRRAFADRERNVEKQVCKLFAEHMQEVEAKIAEVHELLAKQASDLQAVVKSEIAEYHSSATMRPVTSAVLKAAADEVYAASEQAIAKLQGEHDLRLSALLQTIEKLERVSGAVIDLPNPLQSQRRG